MGLQTQLIQTKPDDLKNSILFSGFREHPVDLKTFFSVGSYVKSCFVVVAIFGFPLYKYLRQPRVMIHTPSSSPLAVLAGFS